MLAPWYAFSSVEMLLLCTNLSQQQKNKSSSLQFRWRRLVALGDSDRHHPAGARGAPSLHRPHRFCLPSHERSLWTRLGARLLGCECVGVCGCRRHALVVFVAVGQRMVVVVFGDATRAHVEFVPEASRGRRVGRRHSLWRLPLVASGGQPPPHPTPPVARALYGDGFSVGYHIQEMAILHTLVPLTLLLLLPPSRNNKQLYFAGLWWECAA